MRIAFVGKGGSGKSSISWLLSRYFSADKKVLAIDADYNMDLMHNLGIEEKDITFLKNSEKDIYDVFNLSIDENAFKITDNFKEEVFSINPDDKFTQKYCKNINDNLKLMVLGDHDQETMYSGRCSHAYAKSIKFYLPYLKTKEDEIVLVDSVAGTDMVNYGLYLGVDAIFCVVEDTKNSVAVMNSAKKIAEEYQIPFYTVLNKFTEKECKYIDEEDLITKFYFDPAFADYEFEEISEKNLLAYKEFESFIDGKKSENNIHRLESWKEKNKKYIL